MKKQKMLKVWGSRYFGTEFRDSEGGVRRMVIGAHTKKQAMELGEVNPYEFKNYFCETGNEYELNLASEIGVDTWRSSRQKTFRKMEMKK